MAAPLPASVDAVAPRWLSNDVGDGALPPTGMPRAMLLRGTAAPGKTETARQYVTLATQRLPALYPSGVLWLDGRSDMVLGADMRGLAVALTATAATRTERGADVVGATVRGWLASNVGWLLVVDYADDPAVLARWRPWLTSSGGHGHTLVLSQCSSGTMRGLPGGLMLLAMPKLGRADGMALLLACLTHVNSAASTATAGGG
jgi:hypothetical protein